jgi:cell division protein ZipA
VRLVGQGSSSFAGESLAAALHESGLRHGKFGIFHRLGNESQVVFSVASLVEPGTFDPGAMAAERFPGVTLFFSLGMPGDRLAAFDDMLATARTLAGRLGGELLDERGSRLSVQRERYLREEVIQLQHKSPAS